MSVLDPATPWPWLLYALAGAGLAAYAVPEVLNKGVPAVQRDAVRAHPPIHAVLYLIVWAVWPLLAAVMLVSGAQRVWWRIEDWRDERRSP